jgi:hypothetical protein
MTIQWLGGVVVEGKPTAPDGTELGVWFAPVAGDAWTHVKAIAKKPAAIWYLAKSESAHHCIRHTITGSRAEHVVLGHGGRESDRVTTGK